MWTEEERRFLADREKRNRFGRPAMIIVTAIWIGLWIWLVVKIPLLANPFAVAERIRTGALDPGTTALMAAMCSLLFGLVGVLVLCFLVFALAWVKLESRYLRLLKGAAQR